MHGRRPGGSSDFLLSSALFSSAPCESPLTLYTILLLRILYGV